MKNFLVLFFTLTFLSCSSNQIVNLGTAKDIVKEYYESGKFDNEMSEVIKEAKEKFANIKVFENSVVIFDVDETALNNFGLAKQMGFGYVYDLNKKWNAELKAPAIEQTKDFYNYLLKKGFKIIFLTARNSNEYDVTYKNLIQTGYTTFDTLITQGKEDQKLKSQEFKSKVRIELTNKGYEIVGTVGDQWTDLNGPYSGIQIKLPNYLYEVK
ncbi:MAG: HAD family acid phosphatase [Ignavibacteriaceae bacterium]|nr:HAD family acid phosphatase [Ignavibacterium sp.]MCC6254856.1 HAD family acid phosphatase [Ignavibacteriaceae bacterium]HMN25077.1 HAD family acid phosphatase [Ignavibacteriaceae bacterium]HRN25780.1 HAD family acid phosphatase [Ignavibacteriaceae bacterium]HRP91534.1 HAD family acid phosphatase [Ignavibacteriaceae bacterium]